MTFIDALFLGCSTVLFFTVFLKTKTICQGSQTSAWTFSVTAWCSCETSWKLLAQCHWLHPLQSLKNMQIQIQQRSSPSWTMSTDDCLSLMSIFWDLFSALIPGVVASLLRFSSWVFYRKMITNSETRETIILFTFLLTRWTLWNPSCWIWNWNCCLAWIWIYWLSVDFGFCCDS